MMEQVKNVPSLRFSEYTGEWSNSLLSELAVKITDGTHDTPKTVDRGVPYITAIHVKDGSIDFDGCYFVTEADHRIIYNRCNPQKDDLLIVNIGAGTATCSIVDVDYQFSMKNVALIKPDKAKVFPSFLAHYQRKRTHSMFVRLTSGGAQPFLSLRELGKLVVRYPSLPEQQKIASFLTAIDDKIQQLSKKKALLEQYKKGLMQQLFSQKLRFKDDQGNEFPDWEEKQLGELCKVAKSGGTPTSTRPEYYDGDIPFLSISDMTKQGKYLNYTSNHISRLGLENSSAWIVPIDTIIYSMYASVGFVSINKVEIATSQAVLNLIPMNGVNTEFLYYSLVQFQDKTHKFITTGTQGNLNAQTVKGFQLGIPSHEEQLKIANFLSAIDDKINGVTKQIEHTRQFKKGLLQQMFV